MAKRGTVYINEPSVEVIDSQVESEDQKLDKLYKDASDNIYELSSVFPFQLFPDKIIIDKNKITIIRKQIFFKRVFPILLRDIRTVKLNRGLLFASIEFEIKGYETNPGPTTFLWPSEATKAKQYVLGLMSAGRENIDLSKIPTGKAKRKLKEIGKAEDGEAGLF